MRWGDQDGSPEPRELGDKKSPSQIVKKTTVSAARMLSDKTRAGYGCPQQASVHSSPMKGGCE